MSLGLDTRDARTDSDPVIQEQRVRVEGTSVVTTPSLRRLARRGRFWVILAVALVAFALIAIAIGGTGAKGPSLSGTNASPNGAKALIQVLRTDGVTVRTPRTLVRALSDAGDSGGTLAVYDEHNLLTRGQVEQLRGAAGTLVLIQPSFTMLSVLAPDVRLAGVGSASFAADTSSDCGFGPVSSAGRVHAVSPAVYRVAASPATTIRTCLPNGEGTFSLVTSTSGTSRVIVFGLPGALSNQHIIEQGNAALALGTFGENSHLTWYLPSEADVTLSAADRPAPLPGWVLPTELLAVIVVLAAALWRGRRFGPLVIERLPVVVRASETMEGRARLYQRGSSRQHALDALRIGTIGRLATLCGLPALATVDEIVGAVAALTGTDATSIRSLLVDEVPRTDAQLVALSDRLTDLESTVARATRPV